MQIYGETEGDHTEPTTQNAPNLIGLLEQTALFLWKDWPKDMNVTLLDAAGHTFSLWGICPHCSRSSVFILITTVHTESTDRRRTTRWVAGLRCQGCLRHVLGVADYSAEYSSLTYVTHYPLGKPDDTVAPEIPEHIQPDFKEALRCLWVDAYNATAEMCRRALEASCLDLGAPKKKVLEKMIDWLADQRIITPLLQQAAHKVRLGGNRGAHPEDGPAQPPAVATEPATSTPEDAPVTKMEKDHALAIVDFTRHFFQHVYVIPKQLDKYDFSKPKGPRDG